MAVGESETMRVGRALITTSPLAAWIVIGNAALRADDDCAATRAIERAARATTRMRERRSTNPPSARGSGCAASDRSSDSGLPSPPPSQARRPSGVVAEKRLPLQRRDRPGLAPEFPYRSPVWSASLASSAVKAVALELDASAHGHAAALERLARGCGAADARRARPVPEDRVGCGGGARRAARRLAAAARALRCRPRADSLSPARRHRCGRCAACRRPACASASSRMRRASSRISRSRTSARRAASRRSARLDDVLAALGDGAVVVRSRDELAGLQ